MKIQNTLYALTLISSLALAKRVPAPVVDYVCQGPTSEENGAEDDLTVLVLKSGEQTSLQLLLPRGMYPGAQGLRAGEEGETISVTVSTLVAAEEPDESPIRARGETYRGKTNEGFAIPVEFEIPLSKAWIAVLRFNPDTKVQSYRLQCRSSI